MRKPVHLTFLSPLLHRLRPWLLAILLCQTSAWAFDLQLVTQRDSLTASDSYDSFIQQMRTLHAHQAASGTRLKVTDLGSGALAAPAAATQTPLAGVRTRSIPTLSGNAPSSATPTHGATGLNVKIAVGPRAARSLLDDTSDTSPLLLALLSRLEYETLRTHPALRMPTRNIAILLREPTPVLSLTLADAILPPDSRLGVVASADIDPLVQELLEAAGPREIVIGYAASASEITAVLEDVFRHADALLILSDRLGNDLQASLSILHAAAAARKPALATSEAGVRAGALAAAAPDHQQLAVQAMGISQRLASHATARHTPPQPEYAWPVKVYTNPSVAAQLGIVLPSPALLNERLHASTR